MKTVYYFLSISSFILIFAHICSCEKNIDTPPAIFCDTCRHVLYKPATVLITDSTWSTESTGYYASNLRDELKKVNDSLKNIIYIDILTGDYEYQINPGQTIPYKDGKLTLDRDILSFKAYYNQLPFRYLTIRITAY